MLQTMIDNVVDAEIETPLGVDTSNEVFIISWLNGLILKLITDVIYCCDDNYEEDINKGFKEGYMCGYQEKRWKKWRG